MDATRPRTETRRLAALSVLTATSLLLSGCAGLRLETPAPTAPPPGPVEQVRQRQALTAQSIAAEAGSVRDSEVDETLAAVLDEVAQASAIHVDALGGIWVAFPDASTSPADAAPEASPVTETPPVPQASSVAEVVDLLAEESAAARADAAAVDDGPLARLIASIAIERMLIQESLVAAAAVEAPTAIEPAEPTGIPTGLSADALTPAIVSEDALGQAWEVVAARSAGAERAEAAALAQTHRDTARAWASAAEVAGTGLDPRQAAYALPAQVLDPTTDPAERRLTLAALEDDLTAVWLTLATSAAPTTRTPLIDAAAATARTATGITGHLPALPGGWAD